MKDHTLLYYQRILTLDLHQGYLSESSLVYRKVLEISLVPKHQIWNTVTLCSEEVQPLKLQSTAKQKRQSIHKGMTVCP